MNMCISRDRKSIFSLPICAILIITSNRENLSLIEANVFLDPVSSAVSIRSARKEKENVDNNEKINITI